MQNSAIKQQHHVRKYLIVAYGYMPQCMAYSSLFVCPSVHQYVSISIILLVNLRS